MHLVKRFFGMLVPLGPRRADSTWAESVLEPGEVALWRRMAPSDRRHAVGVARRVAASLGDGATRPVLAAALLHDVGKIEAGFGPYRRSIATLSAMAVRHDPATIAAWTATRGFTRRVGLYLQHPQIGADLLAMAGSDPLTVAWAREHQSDEDAWTIDVRTARALRDADDD
jgi:hypothetical protein